MRSPINFILVGLVFTATLCRGAESSFYRVFSDSVGTNGLMHPVAVTSPLLVDTNNTVFKLGGTTNNLAAMRDSGEISGIRLGMTMSEVVAKWGKPRGFWSRCCGGHRFCYSDVSLVFHGDSLWDVCVPAGSNVDESAGQSLHFEKDLSATSRIDAVVRVLGEPTRRVTDAKWGHEFCVYESPQQALIVGFDSETGRMSHFHLQRREEAPFLVY
jgi:hypothetical protein